MQRAIRVLDVLCVIWAAGCGANASGGSISGTIRGQPFVVEDAIFAQGVAMADATAPSWGGIVLLGSSRGLCETVTAGHLPANFQSLRIDVGVGGTIGPLPSGAYGIGTASPKSAGAYSFAFDATCAPVSLVSALAESGTVALTFAPVGGSSLEGRFDMTMSSGDAITGDFIAENCPSFEFELVGGRLTCE